MCKIFEQNIYRPSADVSTSHIWIKPEEILLSSGPFDSSARNQIKGSVVEIDPLNSMLAVHIVAGKLPLTALITYASYQKLNIEVGTLCNSFRVTSSCAKESYLTKGSIMSTYIYSLFINFIG